MTPINSPKTPTTTTRTCYNTATLLVVILTLLEILFLTGRFERTLPEQQPFRRWNSPTLSPTFQPSHRPLKLHKPFNPHNNLTILPNHLPRSLQAIAPSLRRSNPRMRYHLRHNFSQPLAMHAYIRLKPSHQSAELILLTTGVSMGTYQRNFSVAGCVVGHHVFPVDSFKFDRAICTIPRNVPRGVPITLVLHLDHVLKRAMHGPVNLNKEFVAVLEKGDLGALKDEHVLHGTLREIGHEALVPIRSKLVFEGQFDEYDPSEYRTLPRYEICLGTQIRPSPHLLPDWIDYHRRLGVDFVYIFDNDSEEDIAEMLKHRNDVEVIYWPWERSQIQAFTYSVFPMRARCEWLLLMDSDEYIMVGIGNEALSGKELPLKRYVNKKAAEGYSEIWFHWVVMKNSGHVTPPPEPVPEAYIHRKDPQLNSDQRATLGKTMVQMDVSWVNSNAHARKPGREEDILIFDDKYAGMYPTDIDDTAMIVHYATRSWVEYKDKLRFGRANINNEATKSKLERRNKRAGEEWRNFYMKTSKKDSKVYTHFRGIWRRVTKELPVGTSVTVRYKRGRRCRTFYNLDRVNYAKPLREKCSKVSHHS